MDAGDNAQVGDSLSSGRSNIPMIDQDHDDRGE